MASALLAVAGDGNGNENMEEAKLPAWHGWKGVAAYKDWCSEFSFRTLLFRMAAYFLLEWLLIPVYTYLGYAGWSRAAFILQFLFLLLGSMFQYFTVNSSKFKDVLSVETSPSGISEEEWSDIKATLSLKTEKEWSEMKANLSLDTPPTAISGTEWIGCFFAVWALKTKTWKDIKKTQPPRRCERFQWLAEGDTTPFRKKLMGPKAKNKAYGDRFEKNKTTLGFIPAGRWAGCNLNFFLIAAAPNCMSIISTAVAVGVAFKEWDESVQSTWRLRWAEFDALSAQLGKIHYMTGNIGDYGVPNELAKILFLAFLLHGYYLAKNVYNGRASVVADSANLLLIEKMLLPEPEPKRNRFYFLFIKTIMLWMKVSIFAILYDNLDFAGKANMMFAIVVGLYGNAPLPERWLSHAKMLAKRKRGKMSKIGREKYSERYMVGAMLLLHIVDAPAVGTILTAIITIRFLGIFTCRSHDWSLLHLLARSDWDLIHGGCTELYATYAASGTTVINSTCYAQCLRDCF